MAELTVGDDKQFQTVSAAIAASQDGDTVLVDGGTYINDFAHITTDITLQAVGGRVHLRASVSPPDGKAILTTDGNITINGFTFSGAAVADQNGAGIRMQTGNLTLNDCYFHHNENGILTSSEGGTLTIDDSEFAFNGNGNGGTHNLYVNGIENLIITDSYFHDAVIGHEIKSRAGNTTITNSRIQDQAGTASYSVDIPNGGNATITNNVIEQGPNSENNHILAYGAEGMVYGSNSLVIDDNVIINDKPGIVTAMLLNPGLFPVQFTDNDVFGLTPLQLPAGSGTTFLAVAPVLDTSHPWLGGSEPPPPPPPPPPPDGVVLIGDNGHQQLVGGGGNDTFNGLGGKDDITTGAGHDTIIFDQPPVRSNRDTVTDFSSLDTALLSGVIYTNPAFINYDSVSGALNYMSSTLAWLPTGLALTEANFKIV